MKTNILYFGDNLHVLRKEIPDESVDFCYIDPPFNAGRNFFVIFKDRTGAASAAQEGAFEDTWSWTDESEATYKEILISCPNRDLATTIEALRAFLHETPMMAYLVSMAIRIVEIHRTLKPTGSMALHCDSTASHYLKIIMDVVFGPRNFSNHITWKRSDAHNDAKKQFPSISDHILLYGKSDKKTFKKQFTPHADQTLQDWYQFLEFPDGTSRRMTKEEKANQTVPAGARRFNADNMASPNPRPNLMYEYKGFPYPVKGWRYSQETMAELDAEGKLIFPDNPQGRIMRKRYLDEQEGVVVGDVWTDISQIRAMTAEKLGYPTQKPQALLERLIAACTNEGDVVMDCYCGCGTTVAAAHKLGRKWIGIDVTAVAVGVIKARMEAFPDLKGKVKIEGFPQDFESARSLFEIDPHLFQIWACTLIDAFPLVKKGADSGIDGWLNFLDAHDVPHRGVVQVKGGKVQVGLIRDFAHVVTREKAALGFFICMGDVTKPMRDEAVKEGFWTSKGGNDYPKVQILTVAGLLAGTERAKLPEQDKRSMLGYKAAKQVQAGQQADLFGGE